MEEVNLKAKLSLREEENSDDLREEDTDGDGGEPGEAGGGGRGGGGGPGTDGPGGPTRRQVAPFLLFLKYIF